MTTLETNPIAFFFSPLSPLLGTGAERAGAGLDAGTAVLSISAPLCSRQVPSPISDGKPRWTTAQVANVLKAQVVACTSCTSAKPRP